MGMEWPGTLGSRPQSSEWLSITRGSPVPGVLSVGAEKLWAGTWGLQASFRVSAARTVVKARETPRPRCGHGVQAGVRS